MLLAIYNWDGWNTGDVVIPAGYDCELAYKFVSELFLDNHILITKPIGFYINVLRDVSRQNVMQRTFNLLENNEVLSKNLDLTFLHANSSIITINGNKSVTTSDALFRSNGKLIQPLERDKYLYTVIEDCNIELFAIKACGFFSMTQCSNLFGQDNKYYPMNVLFTLRDYVKVLPYFNDGMIHVRYRNGFTFKEMLAVLVDYEKEYELGVEGALNKTELEWLNQFR